jgi:hypothetical protein
MIGFLNLLESIASALNLTTVDSCVTLVDKLITLAESVKQAHETVKADAAAAATTKTTSTN